MAARRKDRPSWLRYSGVGIEFASAVAVFALIGYLIDRRWDTAPWGLVICAALGLAGGMYNLIRESLAAFKEVHRGGGRGEEDDGSADRRT